jgi:hypothetical protein
MTRTPRPRKGSTMADVSELPDRFVAQFREGRREAAQEDDAPDGVTEDEIARAWTRPEEDLPSREHPGARVRTATQPDGTRVAVVARETAGLLLLITTWRHRREGT